MSSGKIAPIQKEYGNTMNTMEQQLAKNGYHRYPGTAETFLPYKESSGRYRTGLDENASYLMKFSTEDREAEIKRIKETRKRLEDALGVPGILAPNSPFYNFAASKEFLIKKFGTDLKVEPIKLGNDEEYFRFTESEPMKEITWHWMKVHPRVAPSIEAWRKGEVPADIKYYVVDEESETRDVYRKKKEINEAIAALDSLTPTKRKQIARLMGLPVTESTTEEVVYNLLDAQIKETEFKSGLNKGLSPVKLFNELNVMQDARLKVKDLVEQAITHSIYRIGAGGKVTEGSLTISTSKEDLVEYLLDEKNQMDLLALSKKLTGKKIEKE